MKAVYLALGLFFYGLTCFVAYTTRKPELAFSVLAVGNTYYIMFRMDQK